MLKATLTLAVSRAWISWSSSEQLCQKLCRTHDPNDTLTTLSMQWIHYNMNAKLDIMYKDPTNTATTAEHVNTVSASICNWSKTIPVDIFRIFCLNPSLLLSSGTKWAFLRLRSIVIIERYINRNWLSLIMNYDAHIYFPVSTSVLSYYAGFRVVLQLIHALLLCSFDWPCYITMRKHNVHLHTFDIRIYQ